MKHPTYSDEYKTERLGWPKHIPRVCPIDGKPIHYIYADDGKIVYTRHGSVNQVINLYACEDPNCPLHSHPFNPAPRFDYGERHYGADVFRYVGEETLCVKSKPEQILAHLRAEGVPISISTVRRICDDVLNLASFNIDEETRRMLEKDPNVLLGFDASATGEDGPGLWVFLDLLKRRILHTCVVDRMDHVALAQVLETIREKFNITYIGFVSDKEGLNVKCVEEFYPGIPHQYCQTHFLANQWKHAEALDSNVYLPLRKAINNLYIHKVAKTVTIKTERGRESVRDVFKPIDDDLHVMLKVRNVKFQQLRGAWLWEKLREFVAELKRQVEPLDPSARFTRILAMTARDLSAALAGVAGACQGARLLFDLFQSVRATLNYCPALDWTDQQAALDTFYMTAWTLAQEQGNTKDFCDLATFQPDKKHDLGEVLGEWCRLWKSYRPGLFQYRFFPLAIKSNNGCETAISKQKQRAYGRAAKWNIGHLVETRGEAYLRITHCKKEELEVDFSEVYSTYLVRQMRERQQAKIQGRTQFWRTRTKTYDSVQRVIAAYQRGPPDVDTGNV